MRVVKFISVLLLGFAYLNGMQEQQRKSMPRLGGQSLIPVTSAQMQPSPLMLAQAGHKGGHEGGRKEGGEGMHKAGSENEHKSAAQGAPQNHAPVAQHQAATPPAAQSHNAQAPAQSAPHAQHAAPAPMPAPVVQAPIAVPPTPAPAPVVQPAPTPPAPQPTTTSSEEQDIKGIDTVDVDEPQGNWLLKRIWWQRGQVQYEKIKALVEAIMETRMSFFAKRTEWDRKVFDPFYLDVGLGRGVLEELITSLMKRIEDARAKQGQLNPEERALLDALETEKNTVEQLQKDIQLINDIDGRIDDMITLLIQQINKARSYESQSWQNLKGIAQELNDKKARELFYVMSTNWQNVNDISAFIQGQFLQSFEQLGTQAQDQIAKVKSTIQTLKEKGIDLKKHWQEIEDRSKVDKDQERIEAERLAEEEAAIRKKKEEDAKRGFFGKMWKQAVNVVNAVYSSIKGGLSSVWNMTFGRFFSKPKSSDITDQVKAAHEELSAKAEPQTSANEAAAPAQSPADNTQKESSESPIQVPIQQAVSTN